MNLNHSTRRALMTAAAGVKVHRATSLVRSKALFKVVGGRVLLTNIYGYVTTVAQSDANATNLKHDATNGAAVNLCATIEMNACAVNSFLCITGAVANAMTKATSAIRGMDISVILAAGNVMLDCADETRSGSVEWTLYYMPLDAGAYVEVVAD